MTVGSYDLLEKIGVTKTATLYKAVHEDELEKLFLIRDLNYDDDNIAQFRKIIKAKAQRLEKLEHPNIIKFVELIEYNKKFYIVNEFIQGKSLDEIIDQKIYTPKEMLLIFDQVLSGVEFAHNLQIPHFKLSTKNIFVTRDQKVKIGEFIFSETEGVVMNAKAINSDWIYTISPEQITKSNVDERTDIYSLGVILYNLLTGTNPFIGDNISNRAAIIENILVLTVPEPSTIFPAISPLLSSVILKAMDRNAENRFKSILEFREALSSLAFPLSGKKTKKVMQDDGTSLGSTTGSHTLPGDSSFTKIRKKKSDYSVFIEADFEEKNIDTEERKNRFQELLFEFGNLNTNYKALIFVLIGIFALLFYFVIF